MIGLNTLVRILVSSILTTMISTSPDTVTTISLVNVLTHPNELVSAMMLADNADGIAEDAVSMESVDMISAIMQMQQADTVAEEITVVAEAEMPAEEEVQTETVASEVDIPADISVETQIAASFTETEAQPADDWFEVTEDWQDVQEIAAVENTELSQQPAAETPAVEENVQVVEEISYEQPVQEAPAAAPAETVAEAPAENQTETPVEAPAETTVETPAETVTEAPAETPAQEVTQDQIPEESWDEPQEWTDSDATPSSAWTGDVLSASAGVVNGPNGRETYYNLDMSGVVSIMEGMGYDYEYWVRDDGVKMYGDYVMVAANLDTHPRGSIYETSLGYGIVVDTGSFAYDDPNQTDIAVNW